VVMLDSVVSGDSSRGRGNHRIEDGSGQNRGG
jgi:hypothetical protein